MIDPNSETWLEVKGWAEAELARQLAILKNPRTGDVETNVARGEILRLEALLALPSPKKKPSIQAVVDYKT